MELKYILIVLATLFSLCCAVIVRDNNQGKNDYYSSNLVRRRPGSDRVQIRVYRGPESEHEGKKFAPWGFLVRQPADD